PEFDFVAVGIENPREFSIRVGFWSLHDLDAVSRQLRQHLGHVVDAVVDHETGGAGTEPLSGLLGDVPHGEAAVLRLVLGPSEDRAAPGLELNSQVCAVPLRELLVISGGLEEHTADAGHLRHQSSDLLSAFTGCHNSIGLTSGSGRADPYVQT